ncbi:MAG: FtsX-like permease family protein, partial [Bryobacteraceae bacterium]
ATIAAEFHDAVHKIDPNQPVATIQSMNYRLSESVSKPRFTTVLLSTFASLAVILGLIGVYGVMGCRVRSQLRELAVRQALGAQPKEVITHVLGQGLRIVLPGFCLGLAGSLAMSRLVASMLYDTRPNDPLTLLGVSVSVIVAALLACLVPAARAARIDPLRSLRQD